MQFLPTRPMPHIPCFSFFTGLRIVANLSRQLVDKIGTISSGIKLGIVDAARASCTEFRHKRPTILLSWLLFRHLAIVDDVPHPLSTLNFTILMLFVKLDGLLQGAVCKSEKSPSHDLLLLGGRHDFVEILNFGNKCDPNISERSRQVFIFSPQSISYRLTSQAKGIIGHKLSARPTLICEIWFSSKDLGR